MQRQHQRLREEEEDTEDRRQEGMELKALEAESEDFLKRQMAEMVTLEEKQRQAGLLAEDAAPVKLAIVTDAVAEPKEEKAASLQPHRRPAMALGDDEDDAGIQKRKRALVKLEYEQELDEAEEQARRKSRLVEISRQVPSSKHSVFDSQVEWDMLSHVSTAPVLSVLTVCFRRRLVPRSGRSPVERLSRFSASLTRILSTLSWSTFLITRAQKTLLMA